MTKTKIEWADEVWNPVTGCTKVSPGCAHCYAERLAGRFWGERKFTEVRTHPERLDDPLKWKRPRRVFVNSMSDLFHPAVETLWIAEVFSTMQRCPQHTFMILTKRPERMHELLSRWDHGRSLDHWPVWPLPNVWLGVSAETQKEADARIPILLQTPAAVRFVSVEPMLGPVNLIPYLAPIGFNWDYDRRGPERINWVICGGESGPGARPMHPDWARGLRDACQAAQVPFFFKQWGEWLPYEETGSMPLWKSQDGRMHDSNCFMPDWGLAETEKRWDDGLWALENGQGQAIFERVGKKIAGRMLDGRTWEERPGE